MSDDSVKTGRLTIPAAEEILGLYFPVLDHGFVSLVDYMGGDPAIEQAARVAYGQGTRKTTETRGLLRYLHRHLHTSPLEMVEMKFHCSMPIFVARQWIRHRTASVNEMSGRYSLLPMLFYTPAEDQLRPQDAKNKQGRDGAVALDADKRRQAYDMWKSQRTLSMDNYGWLTDNDFARELARIDLPLSTYTQWYWKIDLKNLLHFLGLRVDSHAQWEIQQFGKIMAGMLKRVAPLAYESWIDYEVCGVRMSRMEMDLIRKMLDTKHGQINPRSAVTLQNGVITSKQFSVTDQDFLAAGMSSREVEEFLSNLQDKAVPDFELDLTVAKDGKFFEEQAAAAALSSRKS